MDDEEEISHFGLTLRMSCGAERRQLDADVRHAQARDRAFHRSDLMSLARLVAHDVDDDVVRIADKESANTPSLVGERGERSLAIRIDVDL